MYARSAWGWAFWVAAGCAITVALFDLKPMAQAHPVGTSDRQAYELATSDLFPELAVQHILYMDSIPQLKAADGMYLPDQAEIEIRVSNDTVSATDYVEVLRHEYGHALLYAWCIRDLSGDDAFQSVVDYTTTDTVDVPAQLAGVAAAYRADPGRYGTYARSNLAEWLAEAYVAYMARNGLPPRVKAFYDSLRSAFQLRPKLS